MFFRFNPGGWWLGLVVALAVAGRAQEVTVSPLAWVDDGHDRDERPSQSPRLEVHTIVDPSLSTDGPMTRVEARVEWATVTLDETGAVTKLEGLAPVSEARVRVTVDFKDAKTIKPRPFEPEKP